MKKFISGSWWFNCLTTIIYRFIDNRFRDMWKFFPDNPFNRVALIFLSAGNK
ncbi:MAG: hypothetical protein HZB59_06985 [Ignavibacteriales bacterium]|nr:hypothetical protein [Ignavibacteriales bacterium]